MRSVALCLALVGIAGVVNAQSTPRRSSSARAIRAEMAGVLLQSNRYAEAANEYATLLAYEPDNIAFRLGLARALAWGGRFGDAERQAAELAARRPNDPTFEKLLLETRNELRPSAAQAAQWFRERRVPEYRRIYARALAREHRYAETIAQYDTLMLERGSPALVVERAYVRLDQRDFAGVERDVNESLTLGPSAKAYLLLGDLHRWRGNFAQARSAYLQALTVPHKDVDVAAALGRLARDERPAAGLLPDVHDAPGWINTNTSVGDNLGVNLTTLALRRGTSWQGFDASVGGTVRRFGDTGARLGSAPPSPPGAGAYGAVGADAALSREGARGWWYGGARVRGGFLYHDGSGVEPDASVAATAFYRAWGFGAELATAPAYPSLLTMASFLPTGVNGQQLHENTASVSLAGPIARADVAAGQEISALSDGNLRKTLQATARLPLQPHLALVYTASMMTFAQPSALYWTPERYVSQGAGLEVSTRDVSGFSAATRVLPGFAWTNEYADSTGVAPSMTQAFQVSGGAELAYRARGWEVAAGASYAQGRTGGYRRFEGMLQLRFAP